MIITDVHMHNCFSSDSQAKPEDMVRSAIKKGLKIICFTDHYDKDNFDWGFEDIYDEENYYPAMMELKEKFKGEIDIRFGTEIGIQPHLVEFYKGFAEKYPFDFIIGSTHSVYGHDVATGWIFEKYPDPLVYEKILEGILENILVYKDEFDVLGHLDYFVRYGKESRGSYSYLNYTELIDEILKGLIHSGRGLELNTSGFKYRLPFAHPHPQVLKRYRELGGEILTIGADAHKPEHIAYDFCKVPALLRECGFRYYTVFKERKPEFITLD